MASKDRGRKETKRPKKGQSKKELHSVSNRPPPPEPVRRGRVRRERDE